MGILTSGVALAENAGCITEETAETAAICAFTTDVAMGVLVMAGATMEVMDMLTAQPDERDQRDSEL